MLALADRTVDFSRTDLVYVFTPPTAAMAGSQAFPQHLENARTLAAAYDQITPAQVSAAAKDYLGAEHAVRVLVLPQAPATASP